MCVCVCVCVFVRVGLCVQEKSYLGSAITEKILGLSPATTSLQLVKNGNLI